MKRSTIRLMIFLLATFSLSGAGVFAQDQQPSAPVAVAPFAGATVADWRGKIQLNLPGQSSSVPAQGQVLPPNTLLQTGSGRLLLRLSDGSQILVGPHTQLRIEDPASSERSYFQILIGRIRAFITKRTGGTGPFRLGTPSAVIAVRGTEFEIEVNRLQVTEVDVFEGLVEVAGRESARGSVMLEPGFSTRVGPDGFPEAPQPTDEIRPEVDRSEPGERELKGVKDLKEIGEAKERESELDREVENLGKEVGQEISDITELPALPEPPDAMPGDLLGLEPN